MPIQDYVLFDAIMREVEADNVSARPLGDYSIFKYTPPCVMEHRWNKWNRLARGLVFHMPTKTVVCRPMPKFFNLDELEESRFENLPQEPGVIFEKVDGTCILTYIRDGKVACATPGSLDSPQAQWAEAELARRGLATDRGFIELVTNTTPVMEAIYPANFHQSDLVVNYGDRNDLVLLAALDHNGHDWAPNRVDGLAVQFAFSRPRRYTHQFGRAMPEEQNAEGFVVQWHRPDTTVRVKFKFEGYKYLQKIVSSLHPKPVLELLMTGAYGTLVQNLPDHVRKQADDVAAKLRQVFFDLKAQVEAAYAQVKDLPTRKDQAKVLMGGAIPRHVAGLVFAKIDGNLRDLAIWDVIRKWKD